MDNQPQANPKQELADRLKAASNVLVTVSRNPSIDQLAACIGLGLLLNKQGKHTAAVFSGQVPSTLEFLQPEETLEKNTDSLRDFIISLDKTKADKLRYKVEDDVVRIFITPYRTSISQDDFDFSQGDFNVDLVIALGVSQQEDLDEAITAHGRILHDATVASLTTVQDGGLGSINWHDPQASSLSELVTELAQILGKELLDSQIATALLTGIVAETERFSNDKTSSQTMSASAALMSAGANQQLVASQLEQSTSFDVSTDPVTGGDEAGPDGTLKIEHNPGEEESEPAFELPAPAEESSYQEESAVPAAEAPPAEPQAQETAVPDHSRRIMEPPSLGGTLTANTNQEGLDPSTDPLSMPTSEPPQLLEHKTDVTVPPAEPPAEPQVTPVAEPQPAAEAPAEPQPDNQTPAQTSSEPPSSQPVAEPVAPMTPPPPAWTPPPVPAPTAPPASSDDSSQTLADLEKKVKEAEAEPESPAETLDDAREEVSKALAGSDASVGPPEPVQALNAQPLGDELHQPDEPAKPAEHSAPSLEEQIPGLKAPGEPADNGAEVKNPNQPPPVPPPFMPQANGDPSKSK